MAERINCSLAKSLNLGFSVSVKNDVRYIEIDSKKEGDCSNQLRGRMSANGLADSMTGQAGMGIKKLVG